jgi:hypothetical protein
VIVNESDAVLIQKAKALDMADEKIKVKKKTTTNCDIQ